MKKIYLIAILGMLIAQGCKETSTLEEAYWTNSTNHTITVLPYKGGGVAPIDTTVLLPMQNKLRIDDGGSSRGQTGPGFTSKNSGSDSIVVVYDGLYDITHYAILPVNLAEHYYEFTHPRHIGNPKNYVFEQEKIRARSYRNTNEFIFIEQDFLDAQ